MRAPGRKLKPVRTAVERVVPLEPCHPSHSWVTPHTRSPKPKAYRISCPVGSSVLGALPDAGRSGRGGPALGGAKARWPVLDALDSLDVLDALDVLDVLDALGGAPYTDWQPPER